jgi:hypothetical protein
MRIAKYFLYKGLWKKLTIITVVAFVTLGSAYGSVAYAITPTESRRAIRMGTEYYNKDDLISCSQKNADSYNDLGDVNNEKGKIYQSGLDKDGPYILEMFVIHILKALAQKTNKPDEDFLTKQHVVALVAFAIGEGGDINNASVFNPMNLGLSADDLPTKVWGAGTDGTQSYVSFNVGIEAYARQFTTDNQDRLGKVLSDKESTAADFMHALTYYKEFKGNQFWAEASLGNPDEYYRGRMDLVKTVKNNYEKTAGLVIGTEQEEQVKGMYKPNLLQFADVKNGSVDEYTNNGFDDPCKNETNSNGSPTGTGWDLEGPNKMVFYRQSDPKWASYPFPCNKSPTIGGCGCWAVTSASIISTLSNKQINPKELVQKYGSTTWLLTPPTDYGLNSENIGTDFDKAEKVLRSGGLIGMYSLAGTFTKVQHMMVMRKVSDDGKLFYVYDLRDPNSEANKKGYTKEELMGEGNLQEMYAVTKKGNND